MWWRFERKSSDGEGGGGKGRKKKGWWDEECRQVKKKVRKELRIEKMENDWR